MTPPRILFYVQHLLGIGHLARASRMAEALADRFDVTLVTGGMPVTGFPGPRVSHVALPAVTSADESFSGLVDAEGKPVDRAFEEGRRGLLLSLFRDIVPDILLIEAFPFGRRQMRFELLPLLDAALASAARPLVACSIRDILQQRAKPGRNEETAALVRRYFDLVLVHGDPQFARLENTFPLTSAIHDKVTYTGLVGARAPNPSMDRFDVVVSAGGGAAGSLLVSAAVEAATVLGPSLTWCLVTGPNLPRAAYEQAVCHAPGNMSVHRFRSDFGGLLASASLSVSQAGYNTVCDVLMAGCRSVLVPFAAGGETEQTVRASRLAERGIAVTLAEKDLSGAALAQVVETTLAQPRPAAPSVLLDGATRSAEILLGALAARRREGV